MIKAIIFDCFGVLTTDAWLAYREQHFSTDPEKIQRASELTKKVDRGELNFSLFLDMIATMIGDTPQNVGKMFGSHVRNDRLFECITRDLYGHYKLGILSNAPVNWLPELFSESQLSLFDAIVLSYEIGVIKPDPRAYDAILNKLDVSATETIFIDDRQDYVDAAIGVGMHAFQYQSVDQTMQTIKEIIDEYQS